MSYVLTLGERNLIDLALHRLPDDTREEMLALINRLVADNNRLSLASVPRVLTLEEAQGLRNTATPVWAEWTTNGRLAFVAEIQSYVDWLFDPCVYGSNVRFWCGAKPTSDQMDTTEWARGKVGKGNAPAQSPTGRA